LEKKSKGIGRHLEAREDRIFHFDQPADEKRNGTRKIGEGMEEGNQRKRIWVPTLSKYSIKEGSGGRQKRYKAAEEKDQKEGKRGGRGVSGPLQKN